MAKIEKLELVSAEPEDPNDPRYFVLSKPLTVGDKTFHRLLVDTSELTGKDFFTLATRFRTEYPDVYRSSLSKLHEDIFLGFVIAKLNGIVTEDLQKLAFRDVPLLFLRTQGSLF